MQIAHLRPRRLAVAGALAASLVVGALGAQPRPADAALAEALFRQGRDLFAKEQYAEACAKFAESSRLEPKLGTLLNLAVCHERLGKVATAWAEYNAAATLAGREGQRERQSFAKKQVALLEKKLPRVVIAVTSPPQGLSVSLDEETLPGGVLGTPFPVDPGPHRVLAKAPGKQDWVGTFVAPAGKEELSVTVPPMIDATAPAPPPPVVASAAPSATVSAAPVSAPPLAATSTAGPRPSTERHPTPAMSYAGFAVGGVGVLVGTIAGVMTLSRAGDIKTACRADGVPSGCPRDQSDELSSAKTTATISNVAFAIGAVGIGVGVAGLYLGGTTKPATRSGVRVEAVVGPLSAGLRGAFP